jgi:hypothetical protein
MANRRSIFYILTLMVVTACFAQAQASRTWVSGVGDDANPCSRTAPCKTFAGAISKTAAGGEIDALDPGGFGGVTITKGITIDGGGGQVASILVAGTNGITIAAGPNDSITIRNLTINGVSSGINGIKFQSGAALHVEHCAIQRFTNHGIDIELTSGGLVTVVDTVVRDNAGSGINAIATAKPFLQVSVTRSNFDNNSVGLTAGDFAKITAIDTEASGNQTGFLAIGNLGTSQMSLARSTATNNAVAGVTAGGGPMVAAIRIEGVSVFNNGTGFAIGTNGTILSFGNNYNPGTGTPNATMAPQ